MPTVAVGCYEKYVFRYCLDLQNMVEATKASSCHEHKGHVRCLESSGSFLASGGADDTIQLYDAHTGDTMGYFTSSAVDVHCLAFVPNDNAPPSHLLSGGADGSIEVWDMSLKQHVIDLVGHSACVNSIGIHKCGRLALSCGRDKKLLLWNMVGGKKVFAGNMRDEGFSVAFHPHKDEYLIASSKSVHQTDLQTGKDSAVWSQDQQVMCMSVLSDGTVATGTGNGIVQVWDERTPSKPCIEIMDAHGARIKGIDQIQSNSMMAVSGSADGILKIWDFRRPLESSSSKCLSEMDTRARITCVRVSGDPADMKQDTVDSLSSLNLESMSSSSGSSDHEVESSSQGNGLSKDRLLAQNETGNSSEMNGECEEPTGTISDLMLEEISLSSLSEVEDQELDEEPENNGDNVEKDFLDKMSEISSVLESQYEKKKTTDFSAVTGGTVKLSELETDSERKLVNDQEPILNGSSGLATSNGALCTSEDEDEAVDYLLEFPKLSSRKRKSGDSTKRKKRTREALDMHGVVSTDMEIRSNSKANSTVQGDASKETKSILKTSNRDRNGAEKKNVTWKRGEDLAKVVGVATGVGFDSVAMPNMAALMTMTIERENTRGRKPARGRGGRGRGTSAHLFGQRQNSNRSRGSGRGVHRGKRGRKGKSS